MAQEGSEMNKPSWFSNNLTLGNIITLCAMLMAGAVGYGQLANRMENMEVYRVERSRQTDEKFASISRVLEGLPNLSYRVTATEESLKSTNQRVDASLANISARLSEINQALGSLDTKVAVLTQRIETNTSQRRADAGR
jgi:uncharacterized protein YlxW (UPF0749 family)